ncbi:TPA: hypothetical protein ACFP41_001827 [Neisseria weaveri]
MKAKLLFTLGSILMLGACTYADQRFVTNQSPEELRANVAAVNAAERAERAERRAERRQEMMDTADAIKRANEGSKRIYIIR